MPHTIIRRPMQIPAGGQSLWGDLTLPPDATAIVLFAHGSGSGRHSPRNQFVAEKLNQAGLATLLADLLTVDEERVDVHTAEFRFDIPLLASRLVAIVDWLRLMPDTAPMRIGLFGASTGAGAALVAAAERPNEVRAVVSRGGRPDLAGPSLLRVVAPTLLIVGGLDAPVLEMNRDAMARMPGEVQLQVVDGATHLFEEPGALEQVASLAADWFGRRLR
jgi:dienelactone hydrolase